MLPFTPYDENGKVICQLCGKPFIVITPSHLKKVHSVTYDQYRARFGEHLSSNEFTSKIKYGRMKDLLTTSESDIGEDIRIVDEPVVEENFDIGEILNPTVKDGDPITKMRKPYLDHLRIQFSNMQVNYVIQEFTLGGHLKYSYITDFCDPVLKIIVDFPSTFWHNVDIYRDLTKNRKLEEDKWMIITVPGRSPSLAEVSACIEKSVLTKRK
jgi:hypothetical protein